MGLTIFYSGKIRTMSMLPELIDEVADICRNHQWKLEFYFPTRELPLTGLSFTPEGSESIDLTFDVNGMLVNEGHYHFAKLLPPAPPDLQGIPLLHKQTQYAGPYVHMAIIHLLRYVSHRYLDEFEFVDESEYWETGDVELCRKNFLMFGEWTAEMSRELSLLDGRVDASGEFIEERMEALLSRGYSLDKILKTFDDFDEFTRKLSVKYGKV